MVMTHYTLAPNCVQTGSGGVCIRRLVTLRSAI